MANYSNLAQVKIDQQTNDLKVSKEAKQILEVLNELENFTISLRKKVMEEVNDTNPMVHLNLKDFNQNSGS